MTFDEIEGWAVRGLSLPGKTIEEVEDEYVDLMVNGGIDMKAAHRNFGKLVALHEFDGAYISLVPQYGEWGEQTSMEMLHVGQTTYPCLLIDRNMYDGVWTVYQTDEFDETDVRLIGKVEVYCEGLRFLRNYSEEEANALLAHLLKHSERAWCTC